MNCLICRTGYGLEEHHTLSQAHGGTNSKTIYLCANCHSAAHSAARALKSKSPVIRNKVYFPIALRDRAYPVVQAILSGALVYETKKDLLQDHALSFLQIPVSPRQMARLQFQKQAHGHTSMDSFMAAVITQLTGVRAWPRGSEESDHPPSAEEIGMLKANQ
jgi:hypothetical protein